MRITRAITAAATVSAAVFALTAVTLTAYHDDDARGSAGATEHYSQTATAVGSVGPKWAGCATAHPACEELIATMSAYAVPAPVRTIEATDVRCRVLPEWQRHGSLSERMCGGPTRNGSGS